jgi:hypothetical protein
MKVSKEIDNNFGYEKITQLVDNIPLRNSDVNENRNGLELSQVAKTHT